MQETTDTKKKSGCLRIVLIFLAIILILLLAALFWYRYYFHASLLAPTKLTHDEKITLENKLAKLNPDKGFRLNPFNNKNSDNLSPEAYSEENANREINLTERELNSLIANKPELAEHVAIDLAPNLLSLKLIVPMDEEIIVLGGKTLKFHAGVKLSFLDGKPVVALQGVSLGGVPLPNAWLGELKYVNLIQHFEEDGGFWDMFAKGVDNLEVRDGYISIKLKE